ncbi:MAG: stage V sporulation protein S [Bacillota bacterium]|nr:stage V sporulation protein S [Bacillota bacterium]
METLKVSAHSKTKALAGALAAVIRTEGVVELQAIGAGAVNQAIKAIAVARGYVAPNGINLIFIPSFVEILVNEQERTAIKFTVESR